MMRDIFNKLSYLVGLLPQVLTATIASPSSIELDDCSGANFTAMIGTNGGTLDGSNYLDLVLEDSDDGTTFAAVTNAKYALGLTPDGSGIVATIDDAAEDDQNYVVGYVGPKRFARLKPVVTGTISLPTAILITKGYKDRNAL